MASALHQASDFVLRNDTVTVLVTDAESFCRVEVGIARQALPRGLLRALSADHRPHHVFKALCCGVGEDVVLALVVNAAIRATSAREHLGVVRVLRAQCLCEFLVVQTSISVLIMSLHEESDVIAGNVHADVGQTILDIKG